MPLKMTGAQFKRFLATEWGPDAYWDETEILKNGEVVAQDRDSDPAYYDDGDVVTIVAGTIIPDQRLPPSAHEYIDAVRFARKWLKSQTTVTLMVDVPREYAERFKPMIESLGINSRMAKVTGQVG